MKTPEETRERLIAYVNVDFTPECHVGACPRLHHRIYRALRTPHLAPAVAGTREVSPSCAGLAGLPGRSDTVQTSRTENAAKIDAHPTAAGAPPDATPCEICARTYAGPGVICAECVEYAKAHR